MISQNGSEGISAVISGQPASQKNPQQQHLIS